MEIFKLPDLGEGLPDAEIVNWHVKEGDMVKIDQILVSMETAKAIVEVPSPMSGKIMKLYGKIGDVIKTGAPLVEFNVLANSSLASEHNSQFDNGAIPEKIITEEMIATEDPGTVVGKLVSGQKLIKDTVQAVPITNRLGEKIKATPAVRSLANRLHIDLSLVVPTGPNGSITTQDVHRAKETMPTVADFEPLKGVRRFMAQAMSQSHLEVVPVTIYDFAKLNKLDDQYDLTVNIILALIKACHLEPALNAWFDGKMMSRRLMKNVHLGLAMDTEEGLFVPVIHDTETLSAEALRQKINEYKSSVQNRSIAAEKLTGTTITLTNFGKFGGRYANPIVVPPTVAILGVGKLSPEAVVINNEIKPCSVLPLSLSFDHRAVTGGEAARFLAAVIKKLEQR